MNVSTHYSSNDIFLTFGNKTRRNPRMMAEKKSDTVSVGYSLEVRPECRLLIDLRNPKVCVRDDSKHSSSIRSVQVRDLLYIVTGITEEIDLRKPDAPSVGVVPAKGIRNDASVN
mmetsp:Transcript_25397/g.61176  ORF Transcript_25397/g.61176 Transcript_25397/m.61176 type:complete len:115 (-) Transcript_25397:1202-1546(-)